MIRILICFSILFFITFGCSKKLVEIDTIDETTIDEQMITAYKEGLYALERGFPTDAVKKFSEAEILYPQSIWAPRSALMTAYSHYLNSSYQNSVSELERYLKTYPLHERRNYAYYLMGLSYYEQIVDEKKDLKPIINAKKYFRYIVKEYPRSEFATDASYKLDLIEDFLASKEIYLGRYYMDKQKWIPAINRFKVVLKDYEKTIFVEEALHRLVEIHYKIGLTEEAKKYAQLLGYNYQSSKWYEESYKIFNKDFKKIVIIKNKKKNTLLEKFKSLIN